MPGDPTMPPENAVGNFVKVVQRVPVKIVFEQPVTADHVLGPGMSVTPSVRIRAFRLSEPVIVGGSALLAALVGFVWWLAARQPRRASAPEYSAPPTGEAVPAR